MVWLAEDLKLPNRRLHPFAPPAITVLWEVFPLQLNVSITAGSSTSKTGDFCLEVFPQISLSVKAGP